MTLDKPPYAMEAVLTLERGDGSAAEALRRYAPLADELGAAAIDVDGSQVDLLIPGELVDVDLEHAMRALAWRLLRRFGWPDDDLAYARHLRSAQTTGPPSGPPARSLRIERAGQAGNDGETHGADVGPARFFGIGADADQVLARLFLTVPAATAAAAVAALDPWLSRTEPVAVGLERQEGGHFRAGLLWPAEGDLSAEAARLGLTIAGTGRIEAAAGYLIETATTGDGTALWLRRGADPISPEWPGIHETRPMVIEPATMTEEQLASLMSTLADLFD